MIIDAFLFNGEIDMLEFRLRLLDQVVDRFLIIEADHSFSGKKKPFYIDHYVTRLREWEHKFHVARLYVDPPQYNDYPTTYDPTHPCWMIERTTRSFIGDVLANSKDYNEHDLVFIGDVDEIPSLEACATALHAHADQPIAMHQDFYYYNLKHMRQEEWVGTVALPLGQLVQIGTQRVRDVRHKFDLHMKTAGWHLSYFGGVESIQRKIADFSHREYDKEEFTEAAHVANVIKSGADIFNRNVRVEQVPRSYFPKYFQRAVVNESWWGDEE